MDIADYVCPCCGSSASIRDSAVIYGKSYGQALICDRFPACDTFVGCHRASGKPKGTMAERALREARKRAHASFDPLWRDGKLSRHEAYAWLSSEMGVEPNQCHIGLFDVEQCQRVVDLCNRGWV